MDIILEAVISVAFAIVFGALIGSYYLESRGIFASPLALRMGRVDEHFLRSLLLGYVPIPVFVTLGLAGFFVPRLPDGTPPYVAGGMAVAILGVIRILAIQHEAAFLNPVIVAIAAASAILVYAFFGAQTYLVTLMKMDMIPTFKILISTSLVMGVVVEIYVRTIFVTHH